MVVSVLVVSRACFFSPFLTVLLVLHACSSVTGMIMTDIMQSSLSSCVYVRLHFSTSPPVVRTINQSIKRLIASTGSFVCVVLGVREWVFESG